MTRRKTAAARTPLRMALLLSRANAMLRPLTSGVAEQAADDAGWRRRFRTRLLAWFRRRARDLPWRRTRDPYAIWVSEVMLQQTQVATVVDYYRRFLERFPTIASLAEADEQAVLRLWEGLGYYRRARQLHAAARSIVERHGGTFPRELADVRALPGVGRYTAGAILSIAFDQPQPILEANTIRLTSRLLALRDDPTSGPAQRILWAAVESWLPRRGSGEFNQAMMELGSLVCRPRNPECGDCPVASDCQARVMGIERELPAAGARPRFESVDEAAVVVWRRGSVLLLKQPDGRRWAGLWDFPRFRVDPKRGDLERQIVAGVADLAGVQVELVERLPTIRHGVTRFRITLHCHAARYLAGERGVSDADTRAWLRPDELESLPLSTTGRKLGRLLPRSLTYKK